MSEVSLCLQSLRDFRTQLRRDGNLVGVYWVNRCVMRLQRFHGGIEDALEPGEADSVRMPLDESK